MFVICFVFQFFYGLVVYVFCGVFFFFKQKTAYERRISDWSSDVCSSDLPEDGMAAKESKRKEKARLMAEVIEAVAQTQAATSAATGRLHGAEGAASGRRALLRQLEQQPGLTVPDTSGARRGGKACVGTGRSRSSPYPYKPNNNKHK